MTGPTADQVATAIVAACRETGADPIKVASGVQLRGRGDASALQIVRARAYAAVALINVFRDYPGAGIARMVGAGSPGAFMGNLRSSISKRSLPWWNPTVVDQVKAAIESHAPAARGASIEPVDGLLADLDAMMPATAPAASREVIPAFLPKRPLPEVGITTSPQRPAAAPGKRDLVRMLEEAARNTARLQGGKE